MNKHGFRGHQAVPELQLMDPFLDVSIFTRVDDLQEEWCFTSKAVCVLQ